MTITVQYQDRRWDCRYALWPGGEGFHWTSDKNNVVRSPRLIRRLNTLATSSLAKVAPKHWPDPGDNGEETP